MKFLAHNEIDFKKWDETILKCPSPLVFAQAFYLNATSPGWCALVDGDYKTVMPLTQNKKLGISYLLQPPFTPQLGIFGNDPAKVASLFFSFVSENYKYINIELNFTNNFSTLPLKQKTTFVIWYKNAYSFNNNARRNIAKAVKLNLKCVEVNKTEIPSLSEKYLNSFLKNQLKIEDRQVRQFAQLLDNSIAEDYLKTFLVRDEQGNTRALGHFISNGQHAVFLKGTSFDKDAKSGSMHLLMSHAIEYFKNAGVNVFDFGGGQSSSIAQFFSGLGGEPLEYFVYKNNNLPAGLRWIKK